jgi:hypothetical protein
MTKTRFMPSVCPHCEYDRRFPGFERGGWMQLDNNGPIVSCPMCNPNGLFIREEIDEVAVASAYRKYE